MAFGCKYFLFLQPGSKNLSPDNVVMQGSLWDLSLVLVGFRGSLITVY